jgi:TolB-like protein
VNQGRFKWGLHAVFCGALWILLSGVCAAAADAGRPLLLLPANNPSGRQDAETVVVPRFLEELGRRGISVESSDEIRDLLRAHRIRSVGQIGRDDAVVLRNQSGGRALVFLGLDVYREDQAGAELGISARLLDLETLTLSAAATHGATSESYAKSFGRGRIKDIDALSIRVIAGLVDRLLASEAMGGKSEDRTKIALIPFENASSNRGASDILAAAFISGLMARAYAVLEPGFSHELFLREGRVHRGSIDLHSVETLHREFEVDYVLTGSIESMTAARGDLELAVPATRFHVRVIEAPSGRIVLTHDFEDDGSISEGLFGRGRTTALQPLLELAVDEFIDQLNDTLREETHARNRP